MRASFLPLAASFCIVVNVRSQEPTLSPPLTARQRSAMGCYHIIVFGRLRRPVDLALDSAPQRPIPMRSNGSTARKDALWPQYRVLTRDSREAGHWSWYPNANADSLHIFFFWNDGFGVTHVALHPDSLTGIFETLLTSSPTPSPNGPVGVSRLLPCPSTGWIH